MGLLKNIFGKKPGGSLVGNLLRDTTKVVGNIAVSPIENLTGKQIVKDDYRTGIGKVVGGVTSAASNALFKTATSLIPGGGAISSALDKVKNTNAFKTVSNVVEKAKEAGLTPSAPLQVLAKPVVNSSLPTSSTPIVQPVIQSMFTTKGATPGETIPVAQLFGNKQSREEKRDEKQQEDAKEARRRAMDTNNDNKISVMEFLKYWFKEAPAIAWSIAVGAGFIIIVGVYSLYKQLNNKRGGRRRY